MIRREEYWNSVVTIVVFCLCIGLVACSGGSSDAEPKEKQTTKEPQKLIKKKHDGKWGMVNEEGDTIIPFKFDYIQNPGDGIIPVRPKDKAWGAINFSGETVIPYKFQYIKSFENGIAPAKNNGKWGFINKVGDTVIPFIFGDANSFKGDWAKVEYKKFSLMVNKNGILKLEKTFRKKRKVKSSNDMWEVGIRFLMDGDTFSVSEIEKYNPYEVIVKNKNSENKSIVDFKKYLSRMPEELYLYKNKLIIKTTSTSANHRNGYYDVFSLPGLDRVDKFQVNTEGYGRQSFSRTNRFILFADDPACREGIKIYRACEREVGFRQVVFLYDFAHSAEANRPAGGRGAVKRMKKSGNWEYTCCQVGMPIFPPYNYVHKTFNHEHRTPKLQYGGGTRRILQYPAWSPEDRYLLFHVGYHGVKYPDGDDKSGEVYLVDLRNGLEQARYMKGTIAKHDLKGDRPDVGLAMKLGKVVEEEKRVVVYNQDQSDSVFFEHLFRSASELLKNSSGDTSQ